MTTPTHPLHDFELRFVIDWIEVRVTLPEPSQFPHVQDRMRARWGREFYVEPIDDPKNHSARVFDVTIHDPTGPAQAWQIVQSMARPDGPQITPGNVAVVAVEIAADFYNTHCSIETLAAAALHLQKHHARPPAADSDGADKCPRFTWREVWPSGKKTPHRLPLSSIPHREKVERLTGAVTINVGAEDADYHSRAYAKTRDTTDDEQYAKLPRDQWRARFELCFSGKQLPFRTLDEWGVFDFTKLAPRFAMVESTVSTAPVTSRLHRLLLQKRDDLAGQIGNPDDPAKRAAHRRLNSKTTRADRLLNERIRVALRRLTRAQKCGNSDRISATEPAATERERPATEGSPEYFSSGSYTFNSKTEGKDQAGTNSLTLSMSGRSDQEEAQLAALLVLLDTEQHGHQHDQQDGRPTPRRR